ncbi:MAG: hypothetical protein HYY18_22310 [Planctomycetes bacterium]|nr:hypothetical protein [Planctomycetota bacterium]
MRGARGAVALLVLLAGCGKSAEPPKPAAPEPPEAVFKRMLAVYDAADGKAMWGMLSKRQQGESRKAFESIKAAPEGQVKELAEQLGTTSEAIRASTPESFSTVVMKARLKDAEKMKLYRDLKSPRVHQDGKRLRVSAVNSDGKFEWVLYLVEEDGAWKVDEDLEVEHEIQEVGGDK